ncbi:response regulator transcription factor [bacterium]|nr:response regulator transcription factor [bacterium]MBU1633249.1 response regulator transcription factor [bacterium]MBU1874196.1 response regulator transcription factor [bacterium]
MKVLLVDDSDILRKHLITILSDMENVDIIGESIDTDSAIKDLKKKKPDLVILDIRMPGEGGIHVLKIAREKYPDLKVIIFTDYPYPQYRTRCMEIGADYFFDKSTETEKMIDQIKQLAKQAT